MAVPGGQRLLSRDGTRLACALGLGVAIAGVFWVAFSGPFPLTEYCTRRSRTWVLPLFERTRPTGLSGETFVLAMAAASLAYLAALRLAAGGRPLRGGAAALLLLGAVPLLLLLVLGFGYPLLSSDVFKYILDGRVLAVYGQNPFTHLPTEFARDPFYEMVQWKTHVNAHGPLWRLAEAGSAVVGGEGCERAVLAMKAWPMLAYLGTTATLFGLLRAWQPERAVWGTMVYAWNPLVALEALQSGHNDVVAALPALVAVWAARLGRARVAFPLLAVAVLIKPLALVLGPLLLVAALRPSNGARGDVAVRETTIGIALGVGLVTLAYLPFWDGPATFQGLARGHLFAASPARLVLAALRDAGLPPDRAQLVAGLLANGLFLVLLAGLARAVWLGRLPLLAAALGVFFVYLLVGAQWFNPWYLLWLAPLAALVQGPPRQLGIVFTLLAPLVYPFDSEARPIVLVVFLPMALLAFRWRTWLGWPGPLAGTMDRDLAGSATRPRWQAARGG